MTALINFFLPVIFFTDAFIFLFNWIIKFLNSNYPLPIDGAAFLYRDKGYLNPEYEIPVYLALILLFIFLLLIYHKFSDTDYFKKEKKRSQFITTIKGLVTFFLIIYFLNQLGPYPLQQAMIANDNFIKFYLATVMVLIGGFGLIYRFWKKQLFFIGLFLISVLLLIAKLTFISKLPIYFHDFSFFLGPIIEIAKGKTLFTQVFSRYSFLGVLLLGYLNKFSLFDITYFPLLVWLLYVTQYFICFYSILKISGSIYLALITLFSLLTVNFYSLMHFPSLVPEVGPVRWLPLILSIYFLYRFKNIQSKKYIFILGFLAFFTIDSGIYLIVAYGLTLMILFFLGNLKIKDILNSISWLFLSLISIYLLINITSLIFGSQIINIGRVFQEIRSFSIRGYFMGPIGERSYFWLIIFIYFISLLKFATTQKPKLIDFILLFSANLTIISAIYFVGESHPHNLLNVSLFTITNYSIFIATIIKDKTLGILKSCLLLGFLIMFIIYPALSRSVSIEDNIINQLTRSKLDRSFEPEMISIIHSYDPEAKLIDSNLKEQQILLISPDDAYLFYLLKNKTNLMNADPQQLVLFRDEEDFALKNVFEICPKKIVVDCRILGKCEEFITLNSAHYPVERSFEYEKSFLISRLKTIENKCHLNYRPTFCTQKLCIAQAK